MALPSSAIATVCRSVADFADSRLEEGLNPVLTVIGSPGDAVPAQADNNHRVNFFFYRIVPGGDVAHLAPDEPWLVRIHCLVTAFAVEESQVSAGENDLRLLGEVLRVFHETPILPAVEVEDERVRPRVIFESLNLDALNHLWSTQGDTRLRPSIGYEVSLVPVLPRVARVEPPLVGALGLETRAVEAARRQPFAGSAASPPVPRTEVDTGAEDWAPRICLVDGDACAESLVFAVPTTMLDDFVPRAWVAGRVGPGNQVTLRWETWESTSGWQPHAVETVADPSTDVIDPDQVGGAVTESLTLPFDDRPGQMLLYAVRTFTRASDETAVEVRSNPILISLHSAGGG